MSSRRSSRVDFEMDHVETHRPMPGIVAHILKRKEGVYGLAIAFDLRLWVVSPDLRSHASDAKVAKGVELLWFMPYGSLEAARTVLKQIVAVRDENFWPVQRMASADPRMNPAGRRRRARS